VRMWEWDVALRAHGLAAHRRHQALHDGHRVAGAGDPRHVKCLHAHLAFAMDEGGSPVGDWILARADARWPARCCLEGGG
jgi:hypothetical protein